MNIKKFVSNYYVEVILLLEAMFIMAYTKMLIGPNEGTGISSLVVYLRKVELYNKISTICMIVMSMSVLIIFIRHITNRMTQIEVKVK